MKSVVGLLVLTTLFPASSIAQTGIQSLLDIPQLAVGGGYTSTLTVRDPLNQASREISISFFDNDGNPMSVAAEGYGEVSAFTFALAGAQEKSFDLTATGGARSGWVQIASEGIGTLSASLRFTVKDGAGDVTDAVGILPAEPNFDWTAAVEKRGPNDLTGIAVANPWTSPVTITIDLYQNGTRVPGSTTRSFTLKASGHMAMFVHEAGLFGDAWEGLTGTATLRISAADRPVAATALRADGTQYSSLPMESGSQVWSWSYNTVAGTQTGTWSWRSHDGYTFVGWEQNAFNSDAVRLRGVQAIDKSQFLAEWTYNNGTGDAGQVVFMGVPGKEGTTDVINGRRIQLRSDGSIASSAVFKATRVY
jgi:hypothetical protein